MKSLTTLATEQLSAVAGTEIVTADIMRDYLEQLVVLLQEILDISIPFTEKG